VELGRADCAFSAGGGGFHRRRFSSTVTVPGGTWRSNHIFWQGKKREEQIMRIFIAAMVAASLFATNLFAADATGPLAPGKPAGVKSAQDAEDDHTILWLAVGAGALAGLIALTTKGSSSAPAAAAAATTSTATTSTTTST
jgi:hypothetical protein